MDTPTIVKLDDGSTNTRILAKAAIADYRRVEQACLKTSAVLKSPEVKRLFARFFHSFQINSHFCSHIARTRLTNEQVEAVETQIRNSLDKLARELNSAQAQVAVLFKQHGITATACYETVPLTMDVGIISSSGRRYLECMQTLDELMPKLALLEIYEVISATQTDKQRANLRKAIIRPAQTARQLGARLRRRMNEAARPTAGAGANPIKDSDGVIVATRSVLPDQARSEPMVSPAFGPVEEGDPMLGYDTSEQSGASIVDDVQTR